MIVNENINAESYKKLFMEAEAFLESKGIVNSDKSKIRIQDINDYYAHMQDFFSKDGWQFVMFATEKGIVNEQPLTINLDSRSISVPAAVASCASVQKDQLAEMLIFEVDRFFDIMDLSNTEIFVQWKTADREGDTKIMRRKVVKGGSWKDVGAYLQCGMRDFEYQDVCRPSIGFRCVRTHIGE